MFVPAGASVGCEMTEIDLPRRGYCGTYSSKSKDFKDRKASA